MTINSKAPSLLKYLGEILSINYEEVKKNLRKLQNKQFQSGIKRVKGMIHKTHTSQWMYKNICLMKYSRDKKILNPFTLLKLEDKHMEIVNIDSFSDTNELKNFTFIPYGGGKGKHKKTQQTLLEELLINNNAFTSYYELFLGGFGSVYNSLPLLLEYGIKDIYLSDVNNSLVNTYRQVQKNHKQVQRHLASLDLEYFKQYGKFHPETKEESKNWFLKIHEEFSFLETKKRMNPRRAALFLYLIHNTQGGMLNFDIKTKTNKFSFCYCPKKVNKVPLIINKVEIFNKIFNICNIKFSIKRYQSVNKTIKDDKNSLVLFDPPYVNYEEVSSSNDFLSCSYNYGINDFNHRELLNTIKNSKYSFIYYNNHNPHLESFSKQEKFNYLKKDVTYRNGKEGKECIEILMYQDRNKSLFRPFNYCDFKINEIKKIS